MEETKIILAGFFFFLVDFVFRKHLNTTLKLSLAISREKVMDLYESNYTSLTFDDEEPLCYGGATYATLWETNSFTRKMRWYGPC